MAGEAMRFRNPAGHAGLLHNLFGLLNSLAGFVESRLGLAAQESKTALVHLLVLAGCLIAAGIFGLFGYLFLLASVIFGIAEFIKIPWVWVSLAVAGIHFLLALICVLIARERIKKPIFKATAAELKRDREWLKNLDKQNQSSN
jgi:uncharacterized membrane protein YqjE